MAQLLDYHVGLLRGFLIAKDAHQTILHALEVLLENYNEKAGPLIGMGKAQKEGQASYSAPVFETPVKKMEKAAESEVAETAKDEATKARSVFAFWKPLELELVNELHGEGKSVAEIRDALNARFNTERKYNAVYAKMTAMGLT